MIDVSKFMNQPAAPMPTQMSVCPEGDHPFMIDSDPKGLEPKNLKGISQRTGQPYDFWQLELSCICLSDAVKQKLGRDKVIVRHRVNLDLDASGGLASGSDKNIGLGRLREALGQNTPDWTPAKLLGAGPFIGKVEHTTTQTGTFADISRVAKVS